MELLEAAINYLMPTMVLPKINGEQLWILDQILGLPACRSWFLAGVVRAEDGALK